MGSTRDLKLGDEVIVLATPEGLTNPNLTLYASSGKVLALSYITPDIFLYSIPTVPGASGGAIVNQEGQVVGIHLLAVTMDSQSYGAGIKIEAIQAASQGTVYVPPELYVLPGGIPWTTAVSAGGGLALGLLVLQALFKG